MALRDPDGLLAAGGDLSSERILRAYRQGIFPWYSSGEPILWWTPDPRCILLPDNLHVSRSLRKSIRRNELTIKTDTVFTDVMRACAAPRTDGAGTWISQEMIQAYTDLHQRGFAHSVEAWKDNELVGGLYGVAIGSVFFGESMFSRRTDASKIAFVELITHLRASGFELIDCQVYNPHLESLGATEVARSDFLSMLKTLVNRECHWPSDLFSTES